MEQPAYNFQELQDPRDKRLAREHELLHAFCEKTDKISYEIEGKRRPPETYLIHYHIKSITGVDPETQAPIFNDKHIIEITLPKTFPIEGARIYARTDLWHPNIKWNGRYKGRVCGNLDSFGKMYTLDLLVRRIGEIIQYKNYHADKEVSPYPEDFEVADWIKEYAEPQGIVDKSKGIAIDSSPLVSLKKEEGEQDESASIYPKPTTQKPLGGRRQIILSPPKIFEKPQDNKPSISIKKK